MSDFIVSVLANC